MSEAQPPAPPQWYPDPQDATRVRFWDGTAWTDQVAPAASVQPISYAPPQSSSTGPDSALHWIVPVGRSGLSIAAGYLGIFCVFLVWTGPVVLALSVITALVSVGALRKAKTGGHGTGRAIFGLVGAAIGAIGGLATTYFWFIA